MSPTPEEHNRALTKRVLFKLDCHILPYLALLWLASFIDRSNIGNANIAGLDTDLGLKGNQFNIVLCVFYVTYLLIEMPSNWVMKRMRPNRWIPLLVILWGIVTTLTCLVSTYGGLLAIRLCLGLCEGGILPGMVLYLSTIYKRHELQLRVGIFYASASVSGAFGGLLATAIVKMDGVGNLQGWKWIFLLEGIVTVIFGFLAMYFLPADLESASFLTEEERLFAIQRFSAGNSVTSSAPISDAVAMEAGVDADKKYTVEKVEDRNIHNDVAFAKMDQNEEWFEWGEVVRGILDIQVWLTGFAYFGIIVALYSYSLFLPTIVTGLGYSGAQAQLHTVPPYVPAVVLTVVVAIYADKFRWRGPFILICLPLAIVGYIVAITAQTNQGRYAAVFLMAAGIYPSGPCILSILPNNSSGHYKKATTTALQLAIANTGGFVATFAYTADQAPRYLRGHSIVLAFLALAWVLVACNVLYCKWENAARIAGKREENVEKYQNLWDSGKTRAPIGDRHPEFRFTL